MFFDQLKRECSVVPLIVNIRYSSHKWAQNNLSVIFEEINLKYNELCLLNLPSSYSLQGFLVAGFNYQLLILYVPEVFHWLNA